MNLRYLPLWVWARFRLWYWKRKVNRLLRENEQLRKQWTEIHKEPRA